MFQLSQRAVGRAAIATVMVLATASGAAIALATSATADAGSGCSANLAAGQTRVGHFGGIVRPAHTSSAACANSLGGDPHNTGGTPPLLYHGGAMMSTRSTGDKVVVTPIYWAPTGYTFPGAYKTIINRYLIDAAKDSDKSSNVFATLFEYNGTTGYINYRIQRGVPLNDTTAYPAAGCTTDVGPIYSDNTGYTTCLDDAQVQSEINAQATAHGWSRDLGHIYVMFLPKHVESCFYPAGTVGQACTLNATPSAAYCAYHGQFGGNTVYANMPFPIYSSVLPYTCGSEAAFPTNESPNGNTDADVEISPLSHEVSEAITDPDVNTGWYDSSGYENGDECAYEYGTASGTAGALYNQTINGNHYLTQEEFSNNNFNLGQGGCLQTYIPDKKPAVTALSSHAGSTAGGPTITVTGKTFGGATAVRFGTTPATFTLVDPTHIRATVPAHSAGTVDVKVTNSLGVSAAVTADHYTYS